MKILHTSDWHLGQMFYEYDRSFEHTQFLEWLLDILEQKQIDLLLVSGDLYDVSNPPIQSQKLLNEFIAQAHQKCPHLRMILTGGNHDSGSRVDSPKILAKAFGADLVGNLPIQMVQNLPQVNWDELIIEISKEGEYGVLVGAVPFVRPSEYSLFRQVAIEKYGSDSYQNCMNAFYSELSIKMQEKAKQGQKRIAMGHLSLSGGVVSEISERRLFVGGEEILDAKMFASEFDYVALGHLHKAQKVGRDSIRYSGSPLPMNFSEINYKHQVVLLDTTLDNLGLEILPVPRPVPMLALPQKHSPVDLVIAELNQLEDLKEQNKNTLPFLLIQVYLEEADVELEMKLKECIQNKAVRLCKIDIQYPKKENNLNNQILLEASAGLNAVDPKKIFEKKYFEEKNELPDAEIQNAFHSLLNECLENTDK